MKEMKQAGVRANVNMAFWLISFFAQGGDQREAKHWFKEMVNEGIILDATRLKRLEEICKDYGEFESAEFWLEERCKLETEKPQAK